MALIIRSLFYKNSSVQWYRCLSTTPIVNKTKPSLNMFEFNSYRKYGLLRDDLLNEQHDKDIEEAVRRLPEEVKMQRYYRGMKAHHAELNKSILPKEEWSNADDDHFYLTPYLEEVRAEKEEREKWEADH